MKKVTLEIIKKGRKYFEVRYPEKNPFKLVINDVSQGFQPGQVVTVWCEFEYDEWRGHGKTIATPLTPEQAQEKQVEYHQKEITRWRGYVEDAFKQDKIYKRGLDELKKLGFDVSIYAPDIARVNEVEHQREIKRWKGYVEDALSEGRIYQKGLSKLKSLGFETSIYDDKIAEINNPKPDPNKPDGPTPDTNKIYWSASGNYYSYKVGEIAKHNGQWVEIVDATASYFDDDDEDAYVFGSGPGTTMHYSAVIAPPDVVQVKEREEQERKGIIWDILDIKQLFRSSGTHPERNTIKGEHLLIDDTWHTTALSWFIITEADGIWYCINNSGDGDCWSESNIKSWMAIGFRLDYSPELATRIKKADQYIKDNDISLHYAIDSERVAHYKDRNPLVPAV